MRHHHHTTNSSHHHPSATTHLTPLPTATLPKHAHTHRSAPSLTANLPSSSITAAASPHPHTARDAHSTRSVRFPGMGWAGPGMAGHDIAFFMTAMLQVLSTQPKYHAWAYSTLWLHEWLVGWMDYWYAVQWTRYQAGEGRRHVNVERGGGVIVGAGPCGILLAGYTVKLGLV